MKHILTMLLILTLTVGGIAGLLAKPVAARVYSVQPTNEDGGPPTDQFTTADPIFAVFRADLEGGRICVIDSENRESHCKIIAAYIGTGWSFIAPGLPAGTYRLRASDPGYEFFSVPFTVSPCTAPDCAERRRMSDAVVSEWKRAAAEQHARLGAICQSVQRKEIGSAFRTAKAGRGVIKDVQGNVQKGFAATVIPFGGGIALGFTFFTFGIPTDEVDAYLALAHEVSCGAKLMYEDIMNDPPDPNYTAIARPGFAELPSTGSTADDRVILTLERQRALGRAQLTAYERYLGALADGREIYVKMQAQAVADYSRDLTEEMRESISALREWAAELDDDPVITQPELDELAGVYERVRTSGFTQNEMDQFAAAGLSADEINQVRAVYDEDISQMPVDVSMRVIVNQTADALEANISAINTFGQEAAWVADGRAPKTLSLLPASASLSVGATHTINASVTDSRNTPVVGVSVVLRVTGSNPGSLTATTNAVGVATFSYVGNNPGVDNLSATAGTAASHVATANWSVHVNSPPVLQLSNFQTYEGFGAFFFSFTDADLLDTHTATIDWGDGSPVQPLFVQESGGGSGTLSANHLYIDDGHFTITVIVTDNHGGVASGVAPMNVQNAAPQVFRVGFTTNNRLFKLGDTVTAATSFFDSGARDRHTAVWDWGDGTTTPGVFTETGGTVTLYESHIYTAPGVYLVKLIVTDDDGATGVGEAIETIGFFPTVAQGSIKPVVTETGKISASISGLGLTEHDGVLKVEKPVGATVRRAFMGAATRGFFRYLLLPGDVKLEGISVRWDIAAPSGIQSFNFWGEVTDIVKTKLDASPAGQVDLALREENSNMSEGEVLVVIFDDPNQPKDNTVALLFGAQQTSGDTFALRFAQPLDLSDPDSALTMSLGVSFGYQDQFGQQYSVIEVNGRRMTTSAGGQDDGEVANGALLTVGGLGDSTDNPTDPYATPTHPRADDELYNLRPFVNTGDTEMTVATSNPSNDDNIFFAAFFLQDTAAVVGEGVVLTPLSASHEVGAQHTLAATAQDAQGNLLQGRDVTFEISSGPHAGLTGTATTNIQGIAQFTYTGTRAGTDTITARFVNSEGRTQTSNTVTAEWKATAIAPSLLTVSPASGTYGGTTELSAHLTAGSAPLSGRNVSFNLNGTTLGVAMTDAGGVATIPNFSLADINAGTHSNAIVAHFAGDTGHAASNGAADLIVSKATPRITWNNPSDIPYGTALGNTQLNAAASVPGTFTYAPATGTALHAGSNQNLRVSFTPNDTTNYNLASKDVSINVTKASLTIIADDKSKVYGTVNPPLTVRYNGFVNGEDASTLGGSLSLSTTATTGSPVSGYPITARGLTSSNYAITFVNGELTVTKAVLTITADNKSRIYKTANPPLTFTPSGFVNGDTAATAFDGAPILATAAQTGSSVGVYPVTAAIGTLSSTNYGFTFVPGTLTVNRAPTTTMTDGKMFANNGAGVLTASLLDINSLPIVNRTLTLTLGAGAGAQTCSATTNLTGKASCQINRVAQPLGPGTVSGSFAGDSNYLASTNSASTLIFDYPAGVSGGSFVIGDLNVTVGRQVTFWGAQWANLNPLSGGAAPSSFKGFANQTSTSPATCGGTWATGPGNSSGPPSSIPAYMAVIVSSSITKSGSTIAGNVSQIVIVKTNPGYGSDPGHAGTGTVVAVWCH
jgi:hypothetical protein